MHPSPVCAGYTNRGTRPSRGGQPQADLRRMFFMFMFLFVNCHYSSLLVEMHNIRSTCSCLIAYCSCAWKVWKTRGGLFQGVWEECAYHYKDPLSISLCYVCAASAPRRQVQCFGRGTVGYSARGLHANGRHFGQSRKQAVSAGMSC